MPTMDSVINSSVVSDVAASMAVAVDSVVNSSVLGNIGVAFTNAVNSVSNASVVGAITATQSVSYAVNSVVNTSNIGDIRRLGIIGFDSITNTSQISQFAAGYNVSIDVSSINNLSNVGDVQALISDITIPVFTPIRRPVKSVSSANTGFKKFVFRDIALKGGSHPLTGDLPTVTDFNAVGQSIRNIVMTNKTERFFDDIGFGVGIESYLFDLNTTDLQDRIRENIIAQIAQYEPRAIIVDVVVNPTPSKYQLSIQIFFKIKTTNVTESVTIILERR